VQLKKREAEDRFGKDISLSGATDLSFHPPYPLSPLTNNQLPIGIWRHQL